MKQLPPNVFRTPLGFRAIASVGTPPNRQRVEKAFRRGTLIKTITDWQEDARAELRKARGDSSAPLAGTFAADVNRYLALVRSMPTYLQRRDHLQLWVDALGPDRKRSQITVEQITGVLQGWRTAGLSEATCNKRRTALMHVWSKLDGEDARNPVRAVPKFRVPDPLPRGRDLHAIDAALRQAPHCRTRACARVMLWTGMRPVELERAQPEDVDLKAGTVIVRTAKGGRARVVPLTSQAIAAWKEFDAAGCWDEPDNESPTVKRGLPRKVKRRRVPHQAPFGRWLKTWTGLADLRVYDLRHSYGTELAKRRTRLDVIGSLMGHSTLDLTRRYTLAAVAPEAASATAALGRRR